MVYVSADVKALFLSHDILETLGVLSPSCKSMQIHAKVQQLVHANLLRDEALGILEKVRHGEPT